jgi:hypothetical protein
MATRLSATQVRAILVLASVMAGLAVSSYYLVSGSGSVIPPTRGTIEVAGTARDVPLFRGQVLVWANGGFSDAEVGRIRDSVRVAQISAVRTGFLPVAGPNASYPVIPVETMAVDPRAYAAAVGRSAARLATMLENGVVLSRTGAGLRKLRAGDPLELAGGLTLRVRGVVDDHVLGGYEAAVSAERGRSLGITRAAYALVRPRGTLDTLRISVGRLLGGKRLAFQLPDSRSWFRASNGALPLAQVKTRFGEFATKRLADPAPSPDWAGANLATRTIPVLGEVRCHRLILDDLQAAMADLQRQRLDRLVAVAAFRRAGGCLGAIPGGPPGATGKPSSAGSGLSSMDWGIGLDLTAGGDGPGRANQQLVAVMARHGFTWGGRWLQPRSGHFEWVGEGA